MRNSDDRYDEYEAGSTQYGYYTIGSYVESDEEETESPHKETKVYGEQVADNETFRACISRGFAKYVNRLWQAHPGKFIGVSVGLLLGVLILIFGFFSVFFVLLCGAIGLFIGVNADRDGNFLDNIRRSIPFDSHHWR